MTSKLKSIVLASVTALSFAYSPHASAAGFFEEWGANISKSFDFSAKRIAVYKGVDDKELVDQFYALSEDGKTEGIAKEIIDKTREFKFETLTTGSFTMSHGMFKSDSMKDISYEMSQYTFSTTDDIPGQRYIALAESRGNIVKQYKPAMGGMLNKLFVQNFQFHDANNLAQWLAADNALIEYSASGSIVSAMTRSHQAINNFGARSTQYVNFYFGKSNAQHIENKITNHFFDDNFQRVVSKSGGVTPVVAVAVPVSVIVATPAATLVAVAVPVDPVAAQPVVVSVEKSIVSSSPEKRIKLLKDLAELKKSGVLSDAEFKVEKANILNN